MLRILSSLLENTTNIALVLKSGLVIYPEICVYSFADEDDLQNLGTLSHVCSVTSDATAYFSFEIGAW